MNISKFLSKYDLHDSILEGLKFNGGLLELNIELCNWRQKEYTQKDPEMKMIRLIFNNVEDYIFDALSNNIDSDTILKFESLTADITSNIQNVALVVEGDKDIKIIKFKSSNVDIFLD
jgi:hypothetical protein